MHETRLEPSQIIWTNLVKTNKVKGRRDAIASSITMLTFSRAWFVVRRLRHTDADWARLLDQEPARLYDNDRFIELYDRVIGHFKRQGIRAWIINEANLLDTLALQWMTEMWKECDRQFAVILAARLHLNEQPDEPLRDPFAGVPDASIYRAPRIELQPIEEEEFCTTVLVELFADLKATFSAEAERANDLLVEQAWNYTRGHWDAVTMLATYFDEALGVSHRRYRLVTPQVIEQVFTRLREAQQ